MTSGIQVNKKLMVITTVVGAAVALATYIGAHNVADAGVTAAVASFLTQGLSQYEEEEGAGVSETTAVGTTAAVVVTNNWPAISAAANTKVATVVKDPETQGIIEAIIAEAGQKLAAVASTAAPVPATPPATA